MSAAAVVGYKVYNQSRMFDAMKANIGALVSCESNKLSVSLCGSRRHRIVVRSNKIVEMEVVNVMK